VRRVEAGIFRLAVGLMVVHLIDHGWLQPRLGTAARDHMTFVLVPAVLALVAAVVYTRLEPNVRAAQALIFAAFSGAEAAFHVAGGLERADFSGLLLVPAALLFLAAAVSALLSRPPARSWPRRALRWALTVVGALLLIVFVAVPVAVGVAQTQKPGEHVPESAFDVPHERVILRTADGLDLSGWYIASRNRAAIVVVHGGGGDRRGSRRHARMLARRGYGVLLYDARGRGDSEGDHNATGWTWLRDVDAAIAFLRRRADVDPERIGALGLSTGADVLIEAAAKRPEIKAVVADGSTARSLADIRRSSGTDLVTAIPYWAVAFGTVAVLDQSTPPEALEDLARRIRPKPALFIASNELNEPHFNRIYAEAYGDRAAYWHVDAGHTKGLAEHPREYERRVIGFFDRALRVGRGS
jgi:dienelactone hydrolase